ncbi:MAG: TrkA family potassium uptake protein [Planctomycetes bacterium]|nr:TrkA family potassium uptake protein [Planctomycetota bacterium]MBT6540578.1 TrkA family potassium uptake protein [Planctomycetota bacterium]MBT6784429.1 TrkA family potassium uptake protein [Planctomycetota bacterium]MBT6968780.1 TrkA family potassium uptake protein [Planctomycetota bacterium]MBT7638941.1 TrkA family potassium uptake protein [Planctomycetota bacterium]
MKKERIAVVGLGQFGSSLVRELAHMNVEILAIDKDSQRVMEIAESCDDALTLDILDEEAIREHLIEVKTVVVCIGESPLPGILLTTIAKELKIPRVHVRAHGDTARKILLKLGADDVYSPEKKAARRMALKLTVPNIVDSLPMGKDQAIVEIPVPNRWIGKTIGELEIRQNYAVNLICIRRADADVADFSPAVDVPFQKTDKVFLLGSKDRLADLKPSDS